MGDGTKVTYQLQFDGPMGWVFARMVGKELGPDLARLKERLEAESSSRLLAVRVRTQMRVAEKSCAIQSDAAAGLGRCVVLQNELPARVTPRIGRESTPASGPRGR